MEAPADDMARTLWCARRNAQVLLHRSQAIAAREGRHALEPAVQQARVLFDPGTGHVGGLLLVHHADHQLVFHLGREGQVVDELAHVRAAGLVIGRHHRVDLGFAKVGAEDIVPPGEVLNLHLHVHRVRLPAQEDHGLLRADVALHLGQHAGFGGFNDLETLETELILVDHVLHQAVAVIAGLDADDLAVQLLAELGDVGKALQTLVIEVLRHRQRVLGASQVGVIQHLDLAGLHEGLDHWRGAGVPVTQEDIDLLGLQAREGDGHGGDGHLRLVAQAIEQHRGHARGAGDVAPAHIGEAHGLTGGGFGRLRHQGCGSGRQGRQRGQEQA
jgi:hypothetical protein